MHDASESVIEASGMLLLEGFGKYHDPQTLSASAFLSKKWLDALEFIH